MKSGRLFWGLLLITVGTLFLLASVFNVNLNVGELYKFWPVALILWGISVFVKHDLAKTIIAGLAGLVIGLIFYSLVIKPYACIKESTDFDSCEEIKEVMLDSLNFPVPKESRVIDFSIQGGASAFYVKEMPDTSHLYTIRGYNLTKQIDLTNEMGLDNYRVIVASKDRKIIWPKEWKENRISLALNRNLSYNMKYEIGASKAELDLRNLKILNLDIETGASSFDLRLGEPVNDTLVVDLDAGASSIDIFLPKNIGGEIYSDMEVSSKSYNGFKKINIGYFQTENFKSQKKRIILRLAGGVTSINVNFEE